MHLQSVDTKITSNILEGIDNVLLVHVFPGLVVVGGGGGGLNIYPLSNRPHFTPVTHALIFCFSLQAIQGRPYCFMVLDCRGVVHTEGIVHKYEVAMEGHQTQRASQTLCHVQTCF